MKPGNMQSCRWDLCVCAKGNVETSFAARGKFDVVGQPCLVQD
jgi:hypothetical protein